MRLSGYLKMMREIDGVQLQDLPCFFCGERTSHGVAWVGEWGTERPLVVCPRCVRLVGRLVGDAVADCRLRERVAHVVEELQRVRAEAFYTLALQLELEKGEEERGWTGVPWSNN